MEPIVIIIIISVIGPIIGSLIGVLHKPSEIFMFNMLSFAAGVMIAVSFLELIPTSIEYSSILVCTIGLAIGALFMYLLDRLIPHIHPELCTNEPGCNLKKTSLYLIIGIFLHNFPEGLAIAVDSVAHSKVGFIIAVAIAVQNIPEGICTSAPYYHCNRNRLKSFLVSSSTAIPILVGFTLGYFLYRIIPLSFVGFIIGATAGLMIYISADELIPTSCSKMTNHSTIFSLITGVLFVVLLGYL